MKVSIIVPIYKVEPYIKACLQSVVDQTYRNVELILVDDQSPDASLALAKEVLAQNNFHDYVAIERPANGGLSAARNTGLAAATGDFVLFVDSDDTLEPTMVAEMVQAVAAHGVDVVVCNIWRINAQAPEQREEWRYGLTGVVSGDVATRALLNFQEKAYIWTNLYRRSLFATIRFTENVYYEDAIVQPVLWKEAQQLYFLPRPLYNYFERSGSITTAVGNVSKYLDIPRAYQQLEENFRNDPRIGPDVQALVMLFTHTWMRNLTLTIISGNLPYSQVQGALKTFGQHVKIADVLKLCTNGNRKLGVFLGLLKASPHLYWKRFSTNLLKS